MQKTRACERISIDQWKHFPSLAARRRVLLCIEQRLKHGIFFSLYLDVGDTERRNKQEVVQNHMLN